MRPAVSRKLRFDEITAGTCDQPSQAEVVMVGKVRRQVDEFKSKQKDQVELQDKVKVVRKVDCQGTKVMGLKNIYEVKKDSITEDSRVMSRKPGVIRKVVVAGRKWKKFGGRSEKSVSMSRIDNLFVQEKSQLEGGKHGNIKKRELEDMEVDKPRATKFKKVE